MNVQQKPSPQVSRGEEPVVVPDHQTQDEMRTLSGQAGEVIIVEKPASGETVELSVASDQTYILDFPAEQADVQVAGDDLTLTFDENGDGEPDSQIIFQGLVSVAESGDAPVFQIAGTPVDSGVLVERAIALAGLPEAPLEEVAAEPAAAGGGVFLYNDDAGSTIDLLSASAVIPGTSLQFDTIDPSDDDALLVAGEGGDVENGLAGDRINLALVLDTSGSMAHDVTFDGERITRIEALDRTTEKLLDDFTSAGSDFLRIHMVSFADSVKEAVTVDVVVDGEVDAAALQTAQDFVLAQGEGPLVVGQGNTNFEAGLAAALDWFEDDASIIDDPDTNQTVIISDGEPNRSYAGDGDSAVVAPGSAQGALDHVLGQANASGQAPDTISEADMLTGSFKGADGSVDAVGLNVGADAKAILDQIDSDGSAGNLQSSDVVVATTPSPLSSFADGGPVDDTLTSGQGS